MANRVGRLFDRAAQAAAKQCGRPHTFALAIGIVLVWAICGPLFGFSDTWQLVINTGTTIITFLMVFLIQNTQNRDTEALQVKIDELIRVTELARNRLINLEDLTEEERQSFAPVRQRLVRYHAGSKRWSLFLSSHIGRVEGWSVPESLALIRDLTERATLPQYVYRHKWKVGDLVVWDNRCTMHRARPAYEVEIEYPRDLRRVTLAGTASSLEELVPA